jgi:hypothetical protein
MKKTGRWSFFAASKRKTQNKSLELGSERGSIFAANGAARYGKRAVLHFVQCLDFCNA